MVVILVFVLETNIALNVLVFVIRGYHDLLVRIVFVELRVSSFLLYLHLFEFSCLRRLLRLGFVLQNQLVLYGLLTHFVDVVVGSFVRGSTHWVSSGYVHHQLVLGLISAPLTATFFLDQLFISELNLADLINKTGCICLPTKAILCLLL